MRSMWKKVIIFGMVASMSLGVASLMAQDEDVEEAATITVETAGPADTSSGSFIDVITGGGFVGIVLWLSLFMASGAVVYLAIDSYVKIKEDKILTFYKKYLEILQINKDDSKTYNLSDSSLVIDLSESKLRIEKILKTSKEKT